jgi:hypothetical protein
MSSTGDPIVATGTGFTDNASSAPPTDASAIATAMQVWDSNPALQQYVAQNYGYDAWMLANPELAPILIATAYWGWDQAHVDGALSTTTWWAQNGQAARSWQELTQTDPATAQQQVSQMSNTILAEANSLGVQLSNPAITNLATLASEFNWDSDTIHQMVAQQYASTAPGQGQGTATGGTAAQFGDQAQQLIQQYMVPVSQGTLATWTNNAVLGTADISGFEDYLRNAATAMYPWMKTALAQGMTPQSWFSPYTSQAESILGISSDQVNWTDPKWLNALTASQPDGTTAPVNLTQFANTLRSDPTFGYQYTADAKQQAYTMAQTITDAFGKTAQ